MVATSERLESYTAYSVGCAVVWTIILGVLAATANKETLRKVGLGCAGWWMGWTSATIARWGYPPPKSRPPWRRNHEG